MEEHRQILPSNFSSQHLDTSKSRPPLTDSTGNAQYPTVASTSIWADYKGQHHRLEYPPPTFTLPTLPSQPATLPLRSSLELRRQHQRTQRELRHRNPIVESDNYKNYRGRQVKEGNSKDQKWPDDLEELFLDGESFRAASFYSTLTCHLALLDVPKMGRKKFSFGGKLWGRNELIALYLKIGVRDGLAAGESHDESKDRTRKQVSSHIQVLKGFMTGHPACKRSPKSSLCPLSLHHTKSIACFQIPRRKRIRLRTFRSRMICA